MIPWPEFKEKYLFLDDPNCLGGSILTLFNDHGWVPEIGTPAHSQIMATCRSFIDMVNDSRQGNLILTEDEAMAIMQDYAQTLARLCGVTRCEFITDQGVIKQLMAKGDIVFARSIPSVNWSHANYLPATSAPIRDYYRLHQDQGEPLIYVIRFVKD